MKHYDKVNNIVGWLVFAIAAFTYCSTVEPTASFWDCPEFITTGYKLEVGHPPGAPFFMLTANLFTQFTNDVSQVAYMVNIMSALLSATCILFLFWSITALVRKLLVADDAQMDTAQLITIMGAGIVGALVYTWSDTFWFSAVEGEVYAYSSLFTAVVFWLILKWERRANEAHSDKWLILIAYLMGLSVGVHLLNLLCIPAIVLVYYYKKYPDATLKGSLFALVMAAALIVIIMYGIIPGIVKVGGWFELLFVNGMGMPFNTGLFIYLFLLISSVIWGIYESYTEKSKHRMNLAFFLTFALMGTPFYGYGWTTVIVGLGVLGALAYYLWKYNGAYKVSARMLNTALLSFMMILVGYSSYALIVIRSTANVPMDQNSPEDIFTLGEYLAREQYGTRPLLYGQTYASEPEIVRNEEGWVYNTVKGAPVYQRKEKADPAEKDSYELVRYKMDYKYAQNMLFPRMWSKDHTQAYEDWLGGVDGQLVPYDRAGETVMVKMPTQWDNIRFFFIYQVNFMYWRYFMWNFAGRQNDIQSQGEIEHGNWITGFDFIDQFLVGDQSTLPSELKNNKAHNVFYCLPLLLGIIGLFWQASRVQTRKDAYGTTITDPVGGKQFWIVFFLFFMTGLAIILYLNQKPQEPRERDYAYAGSFYAYAIWIGMGIAALAEILRQRIKMSPTISAVTASVLGICVPLQMVSQTWDDHDRSGRYTCRDFGQNYLNTLPEGSSPIIFTNGDNDTFPLWYNQDVEGIRTDVRVCNLSYLQTDWYIDQMKRPAYDSPALPITWKRIDYVTGKNEYLPVDETALPTVQQYLKDNKEVFYQEFGDNPYELSNILKKWVRTEKESDFHRFPTDSVLLKVNKASVLQSGMMIPTAGDSIPDYMHISFKGKKGLDKSELMMLEFLANADWKRPLYMAITVGKESQLGLSDYAVQEGLAYRITPFNTKLTGKNVDTERMYDNLMNRYKYGGIDKKGIYLDETNLRMCNTHRRLFALLAKELIKEGKTDKALKALDYCEKVIPAYNVPHDHIYGNSADLAVAYFQLGKPDKALSILEPMANSSVEYLTWYLGLSNDKLLGSTDRVRLHFYLLSDICTKLEAMKESGNKKCITTYTHYATLLGNLLKAFEGRIQ